MRGRDFKESWGLLKDVLHQHLYDQRVKFTDHARERMQERRVPEETIRAILQVGQPTEMYKPYAYPYGEDPFQNPDPVFTFVGTVLGQKIAVGFAIRLHKDRHGIEGEFRIVTVIAELHGSRHNPS
ncbi:MAG: DUF4258 domain-containing protein [Bacilli bacterium]